MATPEELVLMEQELQELGIGTGRNYETVKGGSAPPTDQGGEPKGRRNWDMPNAGDESDFLCDGAWSKQYTAV